MGKIYISEFSNVASDQIAIGSLPMVSLPPLAEQAITFGTTTQSLDFNASTKYVRVLSDADCHIVVGANPTATTSSLRLSSGSAEYFSVTPGQKLAAVAA